MREWFEAQLAAGLPAFAGSNITGTLALKPELFNELIARWLAGEIAATASGSHPDLSTVRRAVRSASVRVETGAVLVDFEIRI